MEPDAGGIVAVPRLHVTVEIASPHEHLAAEVALVGRLALGVQAHVLVEVARIAERSPAHLQRNGSD